MKILVLNSGSSSLKFQLINAKTEEVLEKGNVDGIGLDGCKITIGDNTESKKIKDHTQAIEMVLDAIDKTQIEAIGHRVVHGGETYSGAVKINAAVEKKVEELSSLAPLHNPPNLAGIRACKKVLPKVPQVGIFDTAFHQTIPEHAYMYGIPYEFYQKYKIRKYGFHGTSHKYISLEAAKLFRNKKVNVISCHLGNGSSITAIKEGKSVDTTMGFTPLPGVIMGTRCGDIDAEIIQFLADNEKISSKDVMKILNKESGLLGISGKSDMRDIWAGCEKGDKKCILALEMLSYRIAQYIGSYHVVLGHTDAIVFTAGLGEWAWYLREKVCSYLGGLGVKLNKKANMDRELEISAKDSAINVLIIPTNEELMIAKESYELLKK